MVSVKEILKKPPELKERKGSIYDSMPLYVITRYPTDDENKNEMYERIIAGLCPRCSGKLQRNEEGILQCQCGTSIPQDLERRAFAPKERG